MTHPLIDERSVPMAVHSAEVRRARMKLHRDRPDEDPAGAPSGLRWTCHSAIGEYWSLRQIVPGRAGQAVGHVSRLDRWIDPLRRWVHYPSAVDPPRYQTPHAAARALVREVRRG